MSTEKNTPNVEAIIAAAVEQTARRYDSLIQQIRQGHATEVEQLTTAARDLVTRTAAETEKAIRSTATATYTEATTRLAQAAEQQTAALVSSAKQIEEKQTAAHAALVAETERITEAGKAAEAARAAAVEAEAKAKVAQKKAEEAEEEAARGAVLLELLSEFELKRAGEREQYKYDEAASIKAFQARKIEMESNHDLEEKTLLLGLDKYAPEMRERMKQLMEAAKEKQDALNPEDKPNGRNGSSRAKK